MATRKKTPVPGEDLPVIDEGEPDTDAGLVDAAREIFDEDLVTGKEPVFTGEVKRPIIAKLAKIMANLPTIEPKGYNKHFGYPFIKDTQISGALRPRMAQEGLMLIPDVVSEEQIEIPTKNGKSYLTKLKVNFTLIDAESGDSISGHGIGYGDDAGDKGANKALTAAEKYWLMKTFQIGGEDLEDDEQADKRAMMRQAGRDEEPEGTPAVSASNVQGIAKGGRSEKITNAQMKAIGSLYAQLREQHGWTADHMIQFIDDQMGDPLEVGEDADAADVINNYLKQLSGEDAGALITKLADAKDGKFDGATDGAGYGD